jgi:PAS domain S-box-containing protein
MTVKLLERFLKRREMKRNWIIITLTGFVLGVVVLFIFRLHYANHYAMISQFQDHQFLHAQSIAEQLESVLTGYSKGLQTLSSLMSLRGDDTRQKIAAIRTFSEQLEKIHVEAISLYNEAGRLIYSTSCGPGEVKDVSGELIAWANQTEHRGKVFALTLLPDKRDPAGRAGANDHELGSLRFLLATPVYHETSKPIQLGKGARQVGLLAFMVNLTKFLEDRLGLVDPESNLHQVWIVDKDGTLLLQSEHPEMVLKNVQQKGASCDQCHLSFDYVEKVLREREGTVSYQLRNHPKKFAAFAPMEFENTSWIVVVASRMGEVMAFEKRDRFWHVLLIGFVALCLITGAVLISRNYRTIIKTEEEAKHWREKRSLEEKIQQSEVLYRTIVETAHDSIWILDKEGRFTFANKRAEAVLGYQVSDLMGNKNSSFIHPEDLSKNGTHFSKIPDEGFHHSEFRVLRNDGRVLVLSVNTAYLRDGDGIRGTVSFGRDVTEEKQAEKALKESEKQLHYLSSQLLTAQETERRRISRELHDELGGALAVLKLKVNLIERNLHPDQARLREECQQTLSYLDQVIENVQRLTKDLSPHVLEDLGLTAALQWLIGNFTRSYGIDVTCNLIEADHFFPGNTQIIVYRMIQEALNNIGKHSGAKHITVIAENHDGVISFCVEDDGKGFDVFKAASKNPQERGLGLATMNERARMLAGSFSLWSEEGKGTSIRFSIPIQKGGPQQ